MTPEEKDALQLLRRLEREFEQIHRRYAQEERAEVRRKLAPKAANKKGSSSPLTTRRHHGN